MLYSFLSDQVHVNQALTGQQVDFATKRGWFRAIRSPEGAEQVALLATTFGLMTTHTFIEKLQGEGELERYAKWYVEEFKPGYDRLRKIEIKMNHIPQPS